MMRARRLRGTLATACIAFAPATGAQNLIPDPGFEQYMFGCAQGLDLEDLTHWDRLVGGEFPEYYHTCNGINGFPLLSVPDNLNGHEPARSGDAYCGLMTYDLGTQFGNPTDYINTSLTAPLEAGVEYCFQAWLSRADTSHCATGSLQGWLVAGDAPNLFADPDDDWFENAPIVVETFQVGSVGWTVVETTFTANGGENNLTIGSFAYSEQIDTINIVNDFPYGAYYYIDDVYLGSCEDIGIPDRSARAFELTLFPTPALADGYVSYTIKGATGQSTTIAMFDMAGQCVHHPVVANFSGTLGLVGLAKGTYVVIASSGIHRSRKLLIIQ